MIHHRASSTSTNGSFRKSDVAVVSPPTSGNYPTAVPGRLRRRRRKGKSVAVTARAQLGMAVILWYSLGVISIATSKVLLTNGVSPMVLSLQQFGIGCLVLHTIVHLRDEQAGSVSDTATINNKTNKFLPWASVCFALGFLATNLGFSGAAASFVETLKASEPITSAALAYTYGLETVWNVGQITSLASIVAGVVLASSSSSHENATTTPWSSILCVLVANLCFSFRGLFQKLGQREQKQEKDDVRLQLSMQTMGIKLLVIPVLVELIVTKSWATATYSGSYMFWVMINGVAFTSYNLASTFILSRLTVVHHAALNCIRRVFAIVVTSLLFGVPITLVGALGITMALVGFLQYTHYKTQAQQETVLPTKVRQ